MADYKFDPRRVKALAEEADRIIAANPSTSGAVKLALDHFKRAWPNTKGFTAGHGAKQAAVALVDAMCSALHPQSKPVPSKPTAGHFGASVSVASNADTTDGLAPRSITIVARTGGLAFQECWGPCIHDMQGFTPPSGPIPLDWNHSPVVVGVGQSVQIVDGQLIVKGQLIPFTPDDMASEIIFKGESGVPYQASITQNPDGLVTQDVPAGSAVVVNGATFAGPVTVFRKWSISGVALLPYGADGDTSVQFSAWKPGDPPLATVPAVGFRDKMTETLANQLKPDSKPRQGVSGHGPAMDRYLAKQQAKIDALKLKA